MTSQPRLMIVIGQVLADPWLSISLTGQFPTWFPVADKLGIPVRHSHGKRPGGLVRALDQAHEWVRWRGVGQQIVPRVDTWVGKRYLDRIPRVEVSEFQDTGEIAWSQDLLDIYALQRWKVLGSLTQALREDFEFVYFTTASSYVRPAELMRVVQSLPSTGTYAGTRHVDARTGLAFASGANRILSRDVAEVVIRERRHYRHDVMEDVGLGALVERIGIPLVDLPSTNIDSLHVLQGMDDQEIKRNFHFRMTSGSRKNRRDAELMKALHERVSAIDAGPQDMGS